MNKVKKQQLDIVQVFRGLAAIMVIFHHVIPSLGYFQNKNYQLLNYIGDVGKYGVDFFFVLSGFIITYSNLRKENNNVLIYLKNRIIRIYIPYIPISLAMLFLYFSFPQLSQGNREISLLTSLTLFPSGSPALAVAWTLTFEMLFYLLFIICIINKKVWNTFAFIWIISIIIFNFSGIETNNPVINLLFSNYNIEFIMGYVLGLLVLKKIQINKYLSFFLILISALLFIEFRFIHKLSFSFLPNLLFTFLTFNLIYYFLTYKNVKLKKRNVFMMIGNATYSIYLIHGPLHSIIERFLPLTNSVFVYLLYIALISIICVITGYIYYLIFEDRIMNIVKEKLR